MEAANTLPGNGIVAPAAFCAPFPMDWSLHGDRALFSSPENAMICPPREPAVDPVPFNPDGNVTPPSAASISIASRKALPSCDTLIRNASSPSRPTSAREEKPVWKTTVASSAAAALLMIVLWWFPSWFKSTPLIAPKDGFVVSGAVDPQQRHSFGIRNWCPSPGHKPPQHILIFHID